MAELLQKAAGGAPGTQGYDKFVTDMLESKVKKLIAWQQEQYEAQEQDENFKQNQTRFVNRLAQTLDEARQGLESHREVLGTLQDLAKEGAVKQEGFRKAQDVDVVRFTKIADQQDHTMRLLKEMQTKVDTQVEDMKFFNKKARAEDYEDLTMGLAQSQDMLKNI